MNFPMSPKLKIDDIAIPRKGITKYDRLMSAQVSRVRREFENRGPIGAA